MHIINVLQPVISDLKDFLADKHEFQHQGHHRSPKIAKDHQGHQRLPKIAKDHQGHQRLPRIPKITKDTINHHFQISAISWRGEGEGPCLLFASNKKVFCKCINKHSHSAVKEKESSRTLHNPHYSCIEWPQRFRLVPPFKQLTLYSRLELYIKPSTTARCYFGRKMTASDCKGPIRVIPDERTRKHTTHLGLQVGRFIRVLCYQVPFGVVPEDARFPRLFAGVLNFDGLSWVTSPFPLGICGSPLWFFNKLLKRFQQHFYLEEHISRSPSLRAGVVS
ncbi:uncharacterized protein EV154DRAFT_480314 [Mucor mucedo]|uniref:uncharacterized protein n=1 Tax=Mucor mucedo TaxID=29922 RepID=UPI00221F9D15|nr:uncharacterized protein EV154DRAFT_480314 [Mucor mucedo]KAI7892368.1 hypothetical protein EV154DRAFT_480314 [Mucor mucedo]